jgi:hypothetical protein
LPTLLSLNFDSPRRPKLSTEGKLIRSLPVNGDIHDVLELANGNWLAAIGEDAGFEEYDRTGKTVWTTAISPVSTLPVASGVAAGRSA